MTQPSSETLFNSGNGPYLAVSRERAEECLRERIEYADSHIRHLTSPIRTEDHLFSRKREYEIWDDFNRELLRRLFTDDSLSEEYRKKVSYAGLVARQRSFDEKLGDFFDRVERKVDCLESIKARLPLFPEVARVAQAAQCNSNEQYGTTVFLVHGRDNGTKETVARFVEKLRLKVKILHEQVNEGRTIIEKFEHHSEDIGFAIVLFTPDDVGGLAAPEPELRPRARQNVILELGFFMGKLGRPRVAVLYGEGVEPPSDILGVAYILLDEGGAWKPKLAKEIESAGLSVDRTDAF